MKNVVTDDFKRKRAYKITFLFVLVALGFTILYLTLFFFSTSTRQTPSLYAKETDFAIRGDIISKNGFTLAHSNKIYRAEVDTRNIDPAKKDLFIKLFSIYSGMSEKEVRKKIASKKAGRVVLSYNIDSKTAKYLKQLSRKLYKYRIFIQYRNPKTGFAFTRGMDVVEEGEVRVYPNGDILTPVIGHIHKKQDKRIKIYGVKGIERFYEKKLHPFKDGVIRGKRDVAGHIILNKQSHIERRVDGYNVRLNVDLKVQAFVEKMLDKMVKEIDAKEIMCAVMDSRTGKILSIASSNRYIPDHITKKTTPHRFTSFVEHTYEPGSVMKVVTYAMLLKEKKLNPYELVRTYNGRYKLGRKTITDEHRYEWLSAQDVIVHSSNVGIAQIAQRLNQAEFYKGLKSFGFSESSGVDLPYEQIGTIPSMARMKAKIYKATVGYGYGLSANFMQILKAYNAFNNDGKLVSPRIASKMESRLEDKSYVIFQPHDKQVIPASVAAVVNKTLIKTVQKGTGRATIIEGLTIGGKTGTSHISEHGRYVKKYNSSFFGFVNDKKHKYTIGVTVIKPKKKHFASQTAVPTFKKTVEILIDEGYLEPEIIAEHIPENGEKNKH